MQLTCKLQYAEISVLRTMGKLETYMMQDMVVIRNTLQRIVDYGSGNVRSTVLLPTGNQNRFLQPSDMHYGLRRYVWLAYSLVNSVISPIVPIQPLQDAALIKQGQGSSTRSGFLADVISSEYSPSMAADFVAITSTLTTPGTFWWT